MLTLSPSWNFQVVVKASSVYPKDTEAPPCGLDDMTKLAYLHEPGVLANLKSRYDINEIYVCISNANYPDIVSSKLGVVAFIVFDCVPFRHLPWHVLIPNLCFQTYTGNILIAVNPFTKLPHLYDSHMMAQYKGAAFGKLSSHPFAVADAAYR